MIHFRSFAQFLSLTILAALLLNARKTDAADTAAKDPRPNIFFAIADDWSWPHAGVYGDTCVKTPTFDRIAREGILFAHSFTAAS